MPAQIVILVPIYGTNHFRFYIHSNTNNLSDIFVRTARIELVHFVIFQFNYLLKNSIPKQFYGKKIDTYSNSRLWHERKWNKGRLIECFPWNFRIVPENSSLQKSIGVLLKKVYYMKCHVSSAIHLCIKAFLWKILAISYNIHFHNESSTLEFVIVIKITKLFGN